MSKATPTTERELARLLDDAVTQAAREAGAPPEDEQVALLLEGRIDELGREQRDEVLRRIAGDDDAGQTVASIGRLEARGGEARPGGRWLGPWLGVAWAAAACVVVSLASWRLADPPPGAETMQRLQALDARQAISESEQQEQAALSQAVERGRMRDWALGIGGAACVLLTIPVVVVLIRQSKDVKDS